MKEGHQLSNEFQNSKRGAIRSYLQVNYIIGWQPTYLPNQVNGTLILYDGLPCEYVLRTAQQIFHAFFRDHCLEVCRMRSEFADAVGKTQYLPLLLPANHKVFSPLKCRTKPQNRNDGVTGYFNPQYVEHVRACRNDTTDIYLQGGHKVNVHMTSTLVRERFAESMRFQDLYAYRHGGC